MVELPVVLADRIFGQECRTAEVYEARTKHIVDSVVRGFNGNLDSSVRLVCCFQGKQVGYKRISELYTVDNGL